MTPLESALAYVTEGVPVFPCREAGPARKRPYVPHGFHDATRDPATVTKWWTTWPNALIGTPTGRVSRRWVLDIDTKSDSANGFDTLDDLGHSILPDTPMAHTASGGLHVYFDAGDRELRNSAGLIGAGLDVRGDGGYVIVPSPGSGYIWDPILNFDTVAMAPAPEWLWPHRPARPTMPLPAAAVGGLSRYGEAAIESACNAIARAPSGEQEKTLNAECFAIGTAAAAGLLPADIALRALLRAGQKMADHDARWPWRAEEIEAKVRRAFGAGLCHPRETRRALAG